MVVCAHYSNPESLRELSWLLWLTLNKREYALRVVLTHTDKKGLTVNMLTMAFLSHCHQFFFKGTWTDEWGLTLNRGSATFQK